MTIQVGLLDHIARYYTEKVVTHGPGPRGVDWSSSDSQRMRFEQLLKVVPYTEPFTILDYGCGYGALLEVLGTSGWQFHYQGYDISSAMIEHARRLNAQQPAARFADGPDLLEPADYAVASGVFNVKLQFSDEEWTAYVLQTLTRINDLSRLGFAFNVLTRYSDPERMRPDLYYADPGFLFDFCKRQYARNVSVLHDYDLYEFTVIIRKRLPSRHGVVYGLPRSS